MYPEVRTAVEADTGMVVTDPGFDIPAQREQARAAALAEPREDVASVEEVDADGVRCRLYTPADALPGVVVHAHGGGFVLNDVDVHDGVCRRLTNRARRRVLSVDYRRPPEAPFPAAPDDLDTVVGWLRREGPAGPYAAHGDSAGANLALVAALRNPGFFSALALVYPFLDPRAGSASWAEGAASGFDPAEATWYWQHYARTEADLDDPDLAPLLSDRLHTVPPTFVATAEHDPLRDEGEELARRIAESGVETVGVRCLGQVHGFWRHAHFTASEPLLRQVAGWLDLHLS
ncbi:alpha/beta hydrolase [Nocardioides sp. zg-1308]|uniref:Alpha/beta hydrolase n=1 Tax=Nocardioides renjunii TaxID=3095075 RepID=A0ABU5K5N5_9ACTN|nr:MULTISPECIES: alpha/beta hydrolase [unclassified Nocardioides]MDZ5660181.1 alpha/beta hydrolase [Nocardioides sp. S-58]NPD03302.1 alpha/beta hydrolase [Nocardioides sp. zg-1308]